MAAYVRSSLPISQYTPREGQFRGSRLVYGHFRSVGAADLAGQGGASFAIPRTDCWIEAGPLTASEPPMSSTAPSLAETSVPSAAGLLVFAEAAAALRAATDARIVLLGGAPIDGQRHIWWNFVSSSKARIDEAKRNWQHGRFPKVPGDEAEFIPLPE